MMDTNLLDKSAAKFLLTYLYFFVGFMLLPKCLCVQSFFPKVGTLCCSASIKFSGMPQRPKPPEKDDSAMDVVKPEGCDQKFEKPNKLSNCCSYKTRAFEDVSAIQM